MCGRYTREFTWRQVHDFLDLRFPSADEMAPSFNAAPSQLQPVCRAGDSGARELTPMLWGFHPAWAGEGSPAPINARGETAASGRMFKDAFAKRRCLVPASGFYEWKKIGSEKRPYYIHVTNQPVFCFAGIWEPSRGGGAPTFAILTTKPNALVSEIHDRMPVIVDPANHATWLAGTLAMDDVLRPLPAARMAVHPVSKRVGSPKHNDPSLVQPVAPEGLFG